MAAAGSLSAACAELGMLLRAKGSCMHGTHSANGSSLGWQSLLLLLQPWVWQLW